MRAAELLRLAHVLGRDAGGSPRWMARNRAVSTAYYAVFHRVAEFCASELVGAWKPYPAFSHVYRSLDHGRAKTILDAERKKIGGEEAIRTIGDVFTDLQEKRHRADYDPGYRITSASLSQLLADAALAIAQVDAIPAPERKLLAARLIGRTRG